MNKNNFQVRAKDGSIWFFKSLIQAIIFATKNNTSIIDI